MILEHLSAPHVENYVCPQSCVHNGTLLTPQSTKDHHSVLALQAR